MQNYRGRTMWKGWLVTPYTAIYMLDYPNIHYSLKHAISAFCTRAAQG
jgi:hypothetical protein